jgi:diamine N-acetyltransferase
MITLRPLRPEDIPVIRAWPSYPPEFAELDYCLRVGGWLDEYAQKPGTEILVAVENNTLVGFSILSPDGPGIREFRIALHPERIGRGTGRRIMLLTLEQGFSDPGISAIRLIVRKKNLRAQHLYTGLNFRKTGEMVKEIQEKPVDFFVMTLDRQGFLAVNRQ